MVSEHQGSCLNTELSCLWVLEDTSCETSSTRSFTTCVNAAGKEGTNILQELTLSSARISNDTDVDISSELDTFHGLLMNSAKKLEEDTFLDIDVTVD
jgi:hypothetical protein